MSETKEYLSQVEDMGAIHISEDVIASIAAVSAIEVEGVCSLAANLGNDIAELLGKRNLSKGVRLQLSEGSCIIDISVLVKYGSSIQDVAKKVQDAVMNGVEATAGLKVATVNVHVGGVCFDRGEG